MCGEIKDLFHDPAGFLVDHDPVAVIRIALVTERGMSEDILSGKKLCFQRGFHLSAGILSFVMKIAQAKKVELQKAENEGEREIVLSHQKCTSRTRMIAGFSKLYFSTLTLRPLDSVTLYNLQNRGAGQIAFPCQNRVLKAA